MPEGSVYLFALCCGKLNYLQEAETALLHNTDVQSLGITKCRSKILRSTVGTSSNVGSTNVSTTTPRQRNFIPGGAGGIYLLGTFLQRSPARKKEAIEYYKLCLEIDPTLFVAFEKLCDLGYVTSSMDSNEKTTGRFETDRCSLTAVEVFGECDQAWIGNHHLDKKGRSPKVAPNSNNKSNSNTTTTNNNNNSNNSNNSKTNIQFNTPNLTPVVDNNNNINMNLETPVLRGRRVASRLTYDTSGGLGASFVHASGGSVNSSIHGLNMNSMMLGGSMSMNMTGECKIFEGLNYFGCGGGGGFFG